MKTKNNKLATTAFATLLGVGLTAVSMPAMAHTPEAKSGMQKCYGVVKAKMNDCGTPLHACAGQAKTNGNSNEWIMMPKGLCDKIVGGSLVAGQGGSNSSSSSSS